MGEDVAQVVDVEWVNLQVRASARQTPSAGDEV